MLELLTFLVPGGNPLPLASFSLALFPAAISKTCSHKEAERQCCSSTVPLAYSPTPSSWRPVAPGERELYSAAPGFMLGDQKQQVMETAGPVGWLWPEGSGKVVSGPSGSRCHFLFLYPFTLILLFFYSSLPSCLNHFLQ